MPELRSIDDYYVTAQRLETLPIVRAADVQERDPRLNRPAVGVTVGPDVERAPPAMV